MIQYDVLVLSCDVTECHESSSGPIECKAIQSCDMTLNIRFILYLYLHVLCTQFHSACIHMYIYIYTHLYNQCYIYIYTSVERYYTHILYHFSHIYLCAFGHVDFTSQNTRLWNITQCNVLDYTMHDLPRPSHICFFSLQSDTAGYCAALYFGMQKYLILIHPIRARQ